MQLEKFNIFPALSLTVLRKWWNWGALPGASSAIWSAYPCHLGISESCPQFDLENVLGKISAWVPVPINIHLDSINDHVTPPPQRKTEIRVEMQNVIQPIYVSLKTMKGLKKVEDWALTKSLTKTNSSTSTQPPPPSLLLFQISKWHTDSSLPFMRS